ncbi:MAG: YraN family protein [Elusimicrobia bacterium]|nr:YraN family protein [Elusimicrobiota bacterium]MDE2426377.1 YraN family protein [Elusimicrobiota bacterium]
MSRSRELGDQAEERAAAYLAGRGYRILERNFRCRMGELDIIARSGDTVVFVEVRRRSSARFGLPQETVGPAKRRKLLRAAAFYAQQRGLDCPQRFDVVAEGPDGLEHIENAFP